MLRVGQGGRGWCSREVPAAARSGCLQDTLLLRRSPSLGHVVPRPGRGPVGGAALEGAARDCPGRLPVQAFWGRLCVQ